MKTSDFNYYLPPEAVAQEACEPRDASRLLIVRRDREELAEACFHELPRFLDPGDLLVLNDTRVNPWRLVGKRPTGGRVECLILDLAGNQGEGFFKPSRKLQVGMRLTMEGGALTIVIAARRGSGKWAFSLESPADRQVIQVLEEVGRPPLPPYIKREDEDARIANDKQRYQTVFAENPGAVAAPTAGLHMTERVFDSLAERGVGVVRLTLHVGAGTFLPVGTERVEDHHMHQERYEVPAGVVAAVQETRARGNRVVGLGTTVVRSLETAASQSGQLQAGKGTSDIFIFPGFDFQVVGGMVTNFHLPCSSLLMLVSAFSGREKMMNAYQEALARGFRFYSYGDAMLLL